MYILNQEMWDALRNKLDMLIVFSCYAEGSVSNAILYGAYTAQAKDIIMGSQGETVHIFKGRF